jgi:hypothetical protein
MTFLFPTTLAMAQPDFGVEIETTVECSTVTFSIVISGGTPPYDLTWFFNDGEGMTVSGIHETSYLINHVYPAPGSYEWVVLIYDSLGAEVTYSDTVVIGGPTVSLTPDPDPPILELDSGEASVSLIAKATGGNPEYSFIWIAEGWQLDPDPEPLTSKGTATYTTPGVYEAVVVVSDQCELTDSTSLSILVVDEEEDGATCHPTAEKIADAVSTLFPNQADQTYTCEDIYGIFSGNLTGVQIGFGRMWHAYQLALEIEGLTWEMIRDWHLDGFGWGGLLQLNKIADSLEGVDLLNLVEQVVTGELALQDVRSAFRTVTKYEAQFDDALVRLQEGTSPGELGQFYRLASDLDLELTILDGYLEMGFDLSEIRHASKVSEQLGSDWSEVLELHALGSSWGEIGQAYRLASEDTSAAEILEVGIKEYRDELRENQQESREDDHDERTASKLAEQFQYSEEDIWALFNGDCEGNWSCVRAAIRDQITDEKSSERNARTASQLSNKYGVSENEVWSLFNSTCHQSWSCVRSTLRDQAKNHGKPEQ